MLVQTHRQQPFPVSLQVWPQHQNHTSQNAEWRIMRCWQQVQDYTTAALTYLRRSTLWTWLLRRLMVYLAQHLPGLAHNWQSVCVGQKQSSSIVCEYGVPQGSELGPLRSLLHRTSSSNIYKLQRVQNSVARIITRRRISDHITTVLADPHWLPVQYCIQYKFAVITFKVLTT